MYRHWQTLQWRFWEGFDEEIIAKIKRPQLCQKWVDLKNFKQCCITHGFPWHMLKIFCKDFVAWHSKTFWCIFYQQIIKYYMDKLYFSSRILSIGHWKQWYLNYQNTLRNKKVMLYFTNFETLIIHNIFLEK